jgi:hypothetical protein
MSKEDVVFTDEYTAQVITQATTSKRKTVA